MDGVLACANLDRAWLSLENLNAWENSHSLKKFNRGFIVNGLSVPVSEDVPY